MLKAVLKRKTIGLFSLSVETGEEKGISAAGHVDISNTD